MHSDTLPSYPLWDEPQSILSRMIDNIERVILGKRETIEAVLASLLAGGHVLLEDVPGVGKTQLVRSLAKTVDCSYSRIQFTPDLLPSDVTGVSVYHQRTGQFEFRPGPIFAQLVLADELNRTTPKTQAALLEAMEEGQVTADGETRRLPYPFMLLATQNPVDQEGTYGLPEAQLDRFLMRVGLGYPGLRQEIEMLNRLSDPSPLARLKPVVLQEELVQLQRLVRRVHADEAILRYVVEISSGTRDHKDLLLGASPRASAALLTAAKARAFMNGRSYCIPDDVKGFSEPVLAHRLVLSPEARLSGIRSDELLQHIVSKIPVPGMRRAAGS
ncbi:MoxR family ATPase [Paenibacillus sp. CC-CFT747]|nr:MoxR family ATPase [Paenibacillus sp. CC-CFT747]